MLSQGITHIDIKQQLVVTWMRGFTALPKYRTRRGTKYTQCLFLSKWQHLWETGIFVSVWGGEAWGVLIRDKEILQCWYKHTPTKKFIKFCQIIAGFKGFAKFLLIDVCFYKVINIHFLFCYYICVLFKLWLSAPKAFVSDPHMKLKCVNPLCTKIHKCLLQDSLSVSVNYNNTVINFESNYWYLQNHY